MAARPKLQAGIPLSEGPAAFPTLGLPFQSPVPRKEQAAVEQAAVVE